MNANNKTASENGTPRSGISIECSMQRDKHLSKMREMKTIAIRRDGDGGSSDTTFLV